MSAMLYRVINPVVTALLRSPCHRLLSSNTLLLEYTGRRTGRRYRLPISYHRANGRIHAYTAREGIWWRNLSDDAAVRLRIQGRTLAARAAVESEDRDRIAAGLTHFLRAVPRDAKASGVRLAIDGNPDAADVLRAAGRLVAITFDLQDRQEEKL